MRPLIIVVAALLAGCPTVELGDTPADISACRPDRDYFVGVIWPDYLERMDAPAKTCVPAGACHSLGGQGGALHFETMPPDDDFNYTRATGSRLNCGTPSESPLVRKPQGDGGHDVLFAPDAPEIATFLAWFGQ